MPPYIICYSNFVHEIIWKNKYGPGAFTRGIGNVHVVYPALVAGVIGRIDVDALHPALIPGQQGLQRVQIIPVDNHVFAAVAPQGGFSCAFGAIHLLPGVLAVFVKAVLPVKHPERHFLMVVDDLLFSNPFQCRHGSFLPIAAIVKDLSRIGRAVFCPIEPTLRCGNLNFESGPLSGDQRFQHIYDLAVLNVGGVGKLLAVLFPHGFEFPATLNVAQNGGHIRNLPGCTAMGCGGV